MPTKNPYGNTYIADLPEPETISAEEILESIDNKSIDLVCVLGPTASGKTKYAVELARELNRLRAEKYGAASVNATGAVNAAGAEILSGDSRQVYRGMDIGTGKDLNEYGEIPYHLIDIVDAGTKFDLYLYQKAFEKAYKDIMDRGGIPILCGGSGLYLEAATCGYSIPDVPPSPELRAELEEKSMDELVSMLASMKPLHNKTDIDTKKESSGHWKSLCGRRSILWRTRRSCRRTHITSAHWSHARRGTGESMRGWTQGSRKAWRMR